MKHNHCDQLTVLIYDEDAQGKQYKRSFHELDNNLRLRSVSSQQAVHR